MKIAYFGYDFFYTCLEKLLNERHEIIKIFTYQTDNKYNFNEKLVDIAAKSSIPVQFGKVKEKDILDLVKSGCDLIVVAAYPYKIPVCEKLRGINIHPTLLPDGKGPWPLPYIIMNDLKESGVTLHKLSEHMDSGDILLQEKFSISDNENLESLSCKCQLLAPNLLHAFINNFDYYWDNSKKQEGGSYWSFPTEEEQTLDWNTSVDVISKKSRAYGKLESIAQFCDKNWAVSDLVAWKEEHDYEVGSIVHKTNKEVVIAASDGLVCLRFFLEDI